MNFILCDRRSEVVEDRKSSKIGTRNSIFRLYFKGLLNFSIDKIVSSTLFSIFFSLKFRFWFFFIIYIRSYLNKEIVYEVTRKTLRRSTQWTRQVFPSGSFFILQKNLIVKGNQLRLWNRFKCFFVKSDWTVSIYSSHMHFYFFFNLC